ncbi:class A basic helix-loop-helix protein 15 isoform X1 [Brachyistius frenatus]|uniref:class A basic helix-loop-helix protein 15 isoform X1 n=1 Tax=Brachyistius frenatus TaxID=100188 RepID=UPI0037E959DE
MTEAHRMQELMYFRGGATLVISVDGLNWLSKKRCSDKGIKKRDDEELQLWISSGQMRQADEERQPGPCLCVVDQRGSAALESWTNTDHTSSSVTKSSSFSLSPQHCCLLKEPIDHSIFNSLDPFVSDFPKEATRTRLILNMRDIIGWITRNLNVVSQQNAITMDPHNKLIIFCDDCTPAHIFRDIYSSQDCRTFMGYTGCHISDNNNTSVDLKNSISQWPPGPDISSEDNQSKSRDNLNTGSHRSPLKSCENHNHPGESSGRDRNRKMRKSVSFDDDVMVYLFDQESPTLELHSEPYTSLPSSHPDFTSEDSGLEWEDDFSALEKSYRFQCTSRPQQLSLPAQSCSARQRGCLSQTCLVLTYVTESDLEL